ncbi:APC family permease [Francisella frigiditurris]|uniref:Amino acid permease family protein n=1 Tax=Francisella frigiditurris TaxID=1542390 RepID=A0A1J0KV30_9GAMM|nr:APC family permease [Francisella frigiditurris]APC97617.1 amino acid permease family protein [Francisella frigiditurris]
MWSIIFGNPISKTKLEQYTLSKKHGLATFSSDALSSVAYATGEILTTLAMAGTFALTMSLNISFFIAALIIIVGISYIQTINAYPNGGGAYVVAKENLGIFMGLIAGAALLVDYILTVSVSTSAGVLAITSAFPSLYNHSVQIAVFSIVIIAWLNLRGIRDSASILIWPTYGFIIIILLMIIIGSYNLFTGNLHPIDYRRTTQTLETVNQALTVTLLLRAFSSGCSAMTGIEAIANGVASFRPDKRRNANITLIWLIVLLISMFLGIAYLSFKLGIRPVEEQSSLSQLAHLIFGDGFWYYILQLATCLILLVAANTSFAAFPVLASILSRDGFLPAQLKNKDERLAFRNGIIILAILAICLIVAFHADTSALIPLYSIGVFLAFTLCQAGLIVFWYKRRRKVKSWVFRSFINLVGCIATFITVLVITESKFTEGAWIVIVALPVLIAIFYRIRKHYLKVDKSLKLRIEDVYTEKEIFTEQPKILIPISKLHRGTLKAIDFAKTISSNIEVVTINIDREETQKLEAAWKEFNIKQKLTVIETDFQSFLYYFVKYVQEADAQNKDGSLCTVIIPRVEDSKFWHNILHNQRVFLLKWALRGARKETKGKTRVIIEIPYQI